MYPMDSRTAGPILMISTAGDSVRFGNDPINRLFCFSALEYR